MSAESTRNSSECQIVLAAGLDWLRVELSDWLKEMNTFFLLTRLMQCSSTFGPIPAIFQPCSGNHIKLIASLRVAPVNAEIDERPGPVNGDRIRVVLAAVAALTCYVSSGLETSSRLGDSFAESTLSTSPENMRSARHLKPKSTWVVRCSFGWQTSFSLNVVI